MAAAAVGATAVAAGAVALAAGRAVSEFSVRPKHADAEAGGLRVHASALDRVELTRGWETQRRGRYGLEWGERNRAVVGEVLGTGPQTVVRALESGPVPAAGTAVRITPQVYTGDPGSALGLRFDTVAVPGELGPMPAWQLPGVRDLWVVAVHGSGTDRQQTLPLLPVLHRLKVPALAVSYRNDPDAPPSADGIGHFGETEWRDVDAAVRLALDSGAGQILLYGWGLGATMVLQTADRSAWRHSVRGIVLDSPVLDWRDTARRRAARRGVPDALAVLGARAAEGRSGVDPGDIDRLALGDDLRAPVLLMHSPDDTVAPVGPARRLAALRDDLVWYREFPGAEHEALWNSDPSGYEDTVRRFLTPLL
ncbi:S9 family peptidase [Streptacidiphilus sp. P02-A3a]|uniref:alpha/beta hydrolase family protein n=1 Tax=Streptacidiphilus sp. P02-A3a TaxID=2704468 RepID=UPI0015F88523|nr:hypothetical protein [Streptacidiphilus sp. P02-A3a]QMU71959.1 hypothetical protein GXP74_30705 [Streptacidiphilus sp. P02-A3a]